MVGGFIEGTFDGLYSVSFTSSRGGFGSGVVIITNGNVYGGDHAYFYKGTIQSVSTGITGTLEIVHHQGERASVFGPGLDRFRLDFKGSTFKTSLNLEGQMVGGQGDKLSVNCRRVADL